MCIRDRFQIIFQIICASFVPNCIFHQKAKGSSWFWRHLYRTLLNPPYVWDRSLIWAAIKIWLYSCCEENTICTKHMLKKRYTAVVPGTLASYHSGPKSRWRWEKTKWRLLCRHFRPSRHRTRTRTSTITSKSLQSSWFTGTRMEVARVVSQGSLPRGGKCLTLGHAHNLPKWSSIFVLNSSEASF